MIQNYFSNISEMDANLQVFMVLLKTLSKLKLQVMVQCQPSIPNNPDFLVCMDENSLPILVIEVKKIYVLPYFDFEITRGCSSDRRSLRIIHGEGTYLITICTHKWFDLEFWCI